MDIKDNNFLPYIILYLFVLSILYLGKSISINLRLGNIYLYIYVNATCSVLKHILVVIYKHTFVLLYIVIKLYSKF